MKHHECLQGETVCVPLSPQQQNHGARTGSPVSDSGTGFLFLLSNCVHLLLTGHATEAVTTVAYLRDVVNAEGWRQLVSVSEGDLVGGSLQGDLCPQEETVPQCVPV